MQCASFAHTRPSTLIAASTAVLLALASPTSLDSGDNAMAKILVEALPPELLQRVAEYTANPADLQALCLASKCLRTAATPRLYRTVRVGKGWSHLRLGYGLLRRDNPGLAHLQHLHVLGALQVNKMNQVDAIRILLSFLPRDRLLTV